jgi:hypothetical protein
MKKVWTKEMRWNDLARAAVIFGLVPGYDKQSMFAVNAILTARMKSKGVRKRKAGAAQSAGAWYKGLVR